mmetsp:Transcript_28350/g.69037  ORF Transcript_28350/g.69037 Transcript_28350/m.69037 type:complete len:790 (-) Transcript_28350:141-2510(-)
MEGISSCDAKDPGAGALAGPGHQAPGNSPAAPKPASQRNQINENAEFHYQLVDDDHTSVWSKGSRATTIRDQGYCSKCFPMCEWMVRCWRLYSTPIPLEENLQLTAIQKWNRYRRPPWKLILSLFIVICTTTQVIMFTIYNAPYVRNSKVAFQQLFQPEDHNIAQTTRGQKTTYHVYFSKSMQDSLFNTADIYFTQQNTTLDYYGYVPDTEPPPPMRVDVVRYAAGQGIFDTSETFSNALVKDSYPVYSQEDMRRVWSQNISSTVQSLSSLSVEFNWLNYNLDTVSQSCYNWRLTTVYTATTSGRIDYEVNAYPSICQGSHNFYKWSNHEARNGFVGLLVLIVSFCSLSQALYIKALYRDMVMLRIRSGNPVSFISEEKGDKDNKGSDKPSPSEGTQSSGAGAGDGVVFFDGSVPCSEAIKFVNGWFIIATVGNVLNTVHASYCLAYGLLASQDDSWLVLMGCGCLAAWLSITQFFESSSTYYVLIATLQSGIPRVGRFFIGILPIFFAYAVFGVTYFSSWSHRFSSMNNACVTLFSLLNGDVIHDVFDDLHANSPIVSRIYLYSFLALFIYAVLNIFVAIIEDSFFATKQLQDKDDAEGRQLLLIDLLENEPYDRKGEEGKEEGKQREKVNDGEKEVEKKERLLERDAGGEKSGYYRDPTSEDVDNKHNVTKNEGAYPSLNSPTPIERAHFADTKMKRLSPNDGFKRLLDIVDSQLVEDLNNEFAQVCMELKFPPSMLRPPHQEEYYPCGFEDCIYCAIRHELMRNLDQLKDDVKVKVQELLSLTKDN